MSPDKDEYLCRTYPLLYADRDGDKYSTCMYYGFSCGDGWFALIDKLSSELEPLIALEPDPKPRAAQVKEKFGTLRFYMSHETERMSELIKEAEKASAKICDRCGGAGTLRKDRSWWHTLCDGCAV